MKLNISLLFVLLFLSVSILSAQKPEITAESVFVGEAATVIELPLPVYPAAAKALRGKVSVLIDIDESGSVTNVQDATGPGNVCPSATDPAVLSLRDAALDAAKGAKFVPSTAEGKAVTRQARIEYTFGSANPDVATEKNEVYGVQFSGESKSSNSGTTEIQSSSIDPRDDANRLPKTVSGGVLNGKAVSLPKPGYPPAAKALRASGAVSIQVLIYEDGSLYSASAVSGHPLLRRSAEIAACSSIFSPTLLMGNPVKVSGVITYNFVP